MDLYLFTVRANKEKSDVYFMKIALKEAEKAFQEDEVPVGAVAVKEGKIIARARNKREKKGDPTAHAEIELLRRVAKRLGGWRLKGVTIYATLEPCPMCAGALVLARIDRLVYGASDEKMGAVSSLFKIANDDRLNHRISITEGVLAEESGQLLKRFFEIKRKKNF